MEMKSKIEKNGKYNIYGDFYDVIYSVNAMWVFQWFSMEINLYISRFRMDPHIHIRIKANK